MEGYLFVVSAPLAGLAVNVAIQTGLLRVARGYRVGRSVVAGFFTGVIAASLMTQAGLDAMPVRFPLDPLGYWTTNIIAYLALAFCYWAFLNLNITSLRIRILRELLAAPNHALPLDALASAYRPDEMLERRLKRLINVGQAREQDGRYVLAARQFLLLARCVESFRALILPKQHR